MPFKNTSANFYTSHLFMQIAHVCNFVKIILFILIAVANAVAQNQPLVQNFNYSNGLKATSVYDLLFVKSGLLYLGTNNGLYTYNGLVFKKIPFEQALGNAISYLQEDSSGVVWGANFSGEVFYKHGNVLKKLQLDSSILQQSFLLIEIKLICNSIWICYNNLLLEVDVNSKKVINTYKPPLDTLGFLSFGVNNNEVYVFASNKVIYKIVGKKLVAFKNIDMSDVKFAGDNQKLFFYNKGSGNKYYIVTKEGIKSASMPEIILQTYVLSINPIGSDLWVCTNSGVYNLNNLKESWFPNYRVSDIEKDFQGDIWISTLDNGLFKMSATKSTIINSLNNQSVTVIQKHKNQLFVGTDKGYVYKVDTSGLILNKYDFGVRNEIQYIFISADEKLYTTYGLLNLQTGEILTNSWFGRGACEVEGGHILTTSSYVKAAIINKNFKDVPNEPNFKKLNPTNFGYNSNALLLRLYRARTVAYDKYTKFKYVAYYDNLYVYDEFYNDKIITAKEGKSIVANQVLCYGGKVYVASQNLGVVIINKDRVEAVIDDIFGKSGNYIKKIVINEFGFWALTDESLFKINKSKEGNYYIEKVFKNEVNYNDFEILNNYIYAGSNVGLTKCKAIVENYNPMPKVVLTNLNEFSIDTAVKEIAFESNDININYDIIDFSGSIFKVYYALVHNNDTVIKELPTDQRLLNFSGMWPGSYKVYLYLLTSNIEEKNKICSKTASFVILKPIWLRWWFIAIVVSVLFFAGFYLIKTIVNRSSKKQSLKSKLLLSQLAALRAQMNPHFIYNVLNSIQGLIYAGNKSDATLYLSKFSDLMRNALTVNNNQFISLRDEINTIKLYLELEAFRFEPNEFEFNIYTRNIEDASFLKLPAFLIQPHIENAIKHGLLHKRDFKKLILNIELLDNNILQVEIIDNGIGRTASALINKKRRAKHVSFATNAILERISLINSQYKLNISLKTEDLYQQNNPSGTKVTIKIPVSYER